MEVEKLCQLCNLKIETIIFFEYLPTKLSVFWLRGSNFVPVFEPREKLMVASILWLPAMSFG